ncbi:MAG: GvpL/GvpF family gas vesicle protein [Geobacter sp.]|nr:GvpL/GvpF family gas vesicle protein [Geobacter sp.]
MEGRYIYCVAEDGKDVSFGKIGISGGEVYTVHFDGLAAVVHDAPAVSPDCRDRDKMIDWAVSHQRVVDMAWKMFGTVLPIRFHTIIKGGADGLEQWLGQNHGELRKKLSRLRGRKEYGVQVFWDANHVAGRLADSTPALRDLKIKAGAGTGTAYLHGQLLEKALKCGMEKEAQRFFEDIFKRINDVAERIVVEEPKQADQQRQMIMNLSLLVHGGRYEDLKEELEIVDRMDGIAIRLTGPWPPYSFAEE